MRLLVDIISNIHGSAVLPNLSRKFWLGSMQCLSVQCICFVLSVYSFFLSPFRGSVLCFACEERVIFVKWCSSSALKAYSYSILSCTCRLDHNWRVLYGNLTLIFCQSKECLACWISVHTCCQSRCFESVTWISRLLFIWYLVPRSSVAWWVAAIGVQRRLLSVTVRILL